MKYMPRVLMILVLLSAASGCAGLTGLVVGPVSGPISYFEHEDPEELILSPRSPVPFLGLVTLPLAGAGRGFILGLMADIGFLRSGEYGGVLQVQRDDEGTPLRFFRGLPFSAVFDPWAFPTQYDGCGMWHYPST